MSRDIFMAQNVKVGVRKHPTEEEKMIVYRYLMRRSIERRDELDVFIRILRESLDESPDEAATASGPAARAYK